MLSFEPLAIQKKEAAMSKKIENAEKTKSIGMN